MAGKQIRIGQLIAPFGPGSLYTDRYGTPHVVCGLDHWFYRSDPTLGMVKCENPEEFERIEPRLTELLKVSRFLIPPDFRRVRKGQTPPPNAFLNVPAQRFPCWYRNTRTGELSRFNLHSVRLEKPEGGGRWQPVRFISVCSAGHLSEFPWKEWLECQCPGDGDLILTDRGGSELSSIQVKCRTCPPGSIGKKGKTLAGTTFNPNLMLNEKSEFQKAGIRCPGERPWLGAGANDIDCSQPLVAALINQTNLYFPRTISAISLPDIRPCTEDVAELKNEIENEPMLGYTMTLWKMNKRNLAVKTILSELNDRGINANETKVEEALERLLEPSNSSVSPDEPIIADPESELLTFRRAEYNIIRNKIEEQNLRVIPVPVSLELSPWFTRVNLVEKLREMRVFYGFSRLSANDNALTEMPEIAMNQLFRNPPSQPQERWLPAIEVFGEGIYIELDEKRIQEWQSSNAKWLEKRLDSKFLTRLVDIPQCLPPLSTINQVWASRYLLVHSLAHIVINQLVFECGYSAASLRERLFISSDSSAPMAALLIYTSAGDSEGTLGGLVRLGSTHRLGPVIQRAVSRATWCSADPVCSEHLGGQGSRLANLAACHSCILLPETSCETVNQGLDRAMIVGTPRERDKGFMSSLITGGFTLS